MRHDLDALRPWSVGRVAQALELHPFEVLRILVSMQALPRDLRLRPEDVQHLAAEGGLEVWWQAGRLSEPRARTPSVLLQTLAGQLLDRGVVEPDWTRADNLFRGLDASSQATVRRAVNAWIRSGKMGSRMSNRGLEVTVRRSGLEHFRAVADGASAEELE